MADSNPATCKLQVAEVQVAPAATSGADDFVEVTAEDGSSPTAMLASMQSVSHSQERQTALLERQTALLH